MKQENVLGQCKSIGRRWFLATPRFICGFLRHWVFPALLAFMASISVVYGAAGETDRNPPSQGAKNPRLANPDFTLPDPVLFGVTIETGDIKKARYWLDQGLPPDYMADKIGSGLMIAAWEGNLPMMALFFERGADINLVNHSGEQALLLAVWKGQKKAVDWLLSHGAEVNRKTGEWTALHYAAFSGQKDLTRHLLDQGADINARSPNGSTPLMMSIYDGKPDIARLLIQEGADTRLKNEWGDGAMEWAMRFNQIQIARQIGDPEAFIEAANQPKESWGEDARSVMAPADLDQLLKARRYLASKGLSLTDIDRNISALRARYAREWVQKNTPPAASATLEITASQENPSQQSVTLKNSKPPTAPSSGYKLPPSAPRKIPARK